MVTSIADPEVRQTLSNARGGARQHPPVPFQVVLDGQPVQVPPPFPSPLEWRDQWIYFLMVDRFNNPQQAPLHPPYDNVINTFQGGPSME